MATAAKPAAAEAGTPAPKKSKKWLIIGIAVLVLVVGVAAAAVLMMSKGSSQEGEDGEVTSEKAKPDKKKAGKETAPVYMALDVFTVNLAPETDGQFLQVNISVEVDNASIAEKIKTYTPKIRNNITLLLSSKKSTDLSATEGKESLAKEIRTQINQILEPGSKEIEGPVKEVLFTSFIIQ